MRRAPSCALAGVFVHVPFTSLILICALLDAQERLEELGLLLGIVLRVDVEVTIDRRAALDGDHTIVCTLRLRDRDRTAGINRDRRDLEVGLALGDGLVGVRDVQEASTLIASAAPA